MTAINRRRILRADLLAAGAGVLSACTSGPSGTTGLVLSTDLRVAEAEARRHTTGQTRTIRLTAQTGPVDLFQIVVVRWSLHLCSSP